MEMFKGLRVFIKSTSRYYRDEASNPKEVGGVILSMDDDANTQSDRSDLGITVKWDNGTRNSYHKSDLEVREKSIPKGARVSIHPSSQFFGVNSNNPKGVQGEVLSNEGYLGHRVSWDNGTQNSYRTRDLIVERMPEPKAEPVAAPVEETTRLVLSGYPIVEGRPTGPIHAIDVTDVSKLPHTAAVAGFGTTGLDLAFSRPFHELCTSTRDLTQFPFIYMMKDGKIFQMKDKPTYGEKVKKAGTVQLEIGALYKLTKPNRTIFDDGTIVELLEQEPAEYVGSLPYRVKKVNTERTDWIGSGCELIKL